jgi:O-antigen/teichoic acid export membrane protein
MRPIDKRSSDKAAQTAPTTGSDPVTDLLELSPRPYFVNVLFNLLSGAATAIGTFVCPIFLANHMTSAEFSTWVVGFPAVSYSLLLAGILTTLTIQGVAPLAASRDANAARQLVSTLAFTAVFVAASFCLCMWVMGPAIASWTDSAAAGHIKVGLAWRAFGVVAGAAIPILVINAIFSGLQRYEWDCLYKVCLQTVFIFGLLIAGRQETIGLESAIAIYATAQLAAASTIIAGALRSGVFELVSTSSVRSSALGWMRTRTGGLLSWQIGILLVTGLDIILVTRFDSQATAGYALALACTTAVSGVAGAAISPVVPRLAFVRADTGALAVLQLFLKGQRYLLLGLAVLLAVAIALPSTSFMQLIPATSRATFSTIFPLLTAAIALRLTTSLYAATVLSAGLQHKIIASPLVEGVVNVVASYVLATRFGAIGVAMGTLAGALVCVIAHSLFNSPRTQMAIALRPWELVLPFRTFENR